MKKHIPALALIFFGPMLPQAALAETTTFENPMAGRFRADFCRYVGVDCGIAAAFDWCRQNGYEQIVTYVGERDIGTTIRIGDRSVCRELECDGFSSITCTREGPPRSLFGRETPDRPVRPYTGSSDEN